MEIELDEKQQWITVRPELSQDFKFDDKWEKAIGIFESRINKKFFTPVQLIIDQKILKGEGFTIVTVQCALMEMFAAFREGKIYNSSRRKQKPHYEYSESGQLFIRFLHKASIFQDHFWLSVPNGAKNLMKPPFIAKEFYSNVRCGLMHEARTKNNWYITSTPSSIPVKTSTTFIIKDSDKNKIYRTVLHHRLKAYMSEYANELRQQNSTGEELRKFFARKMDNLFDFPADKNFKWWI